MNASNYSRINLLCETLYKSFELIFFMKLCRILLRKEAEDLMMK